MARPSPQESEIRGTLRWWATTARSVAGFMALTMAVMATPDIATWATRRKAAIDDDDTRPNSCYMPYHLQQLVTKQGIDAVRRTVTINNVCKGVRTEDVAEYINVPDTPGSNDPNQFAGATGVR